MRNFRKDTMTGALSLLTVSLTLILASGCSEDRSFGVAPENTAGAPTFLVSPPATPASPLGVRENSREIGPSGGAVTVDGFKVEFPPGAVQEATLISLAVADQEHCIFRVEPADLELSAPATLVFHRLNNTDSDQCEALSFMRSDGGGWAALATTREGVNLQGVTDRLGDFAVGELTADSGAVEFARYLSGPGYTTELIAADRGGIVRYDRYEVRIPRNALDEDTYITVRDPGSEYLICELEPHGILFNVPVSLTIDCRRLDLGPYTDWSIWWLNENSGMWEDQQGAFDGKTIEAELEHFSRYGGGRAGW
ncbi:MAG: hypothetical protein GF355_12470 [Candidatus Eisenbacteria bacterium]|nr:hypothetical protein [Candidatus Eisenbacteria bacterium]